MPTKHVHLFHRKPKNARWDSGHAHQANRCCPCYIPGDIPFEKTPGGHLVDCSFFPAEVLMMNLRSIKRTGLATRVPANMTPRQCEVFAKELDHVVDDLQSHFAQENPKPKAFGPGWYVEWDYDRNRYVPYEEFEAHDIVAMLEDAVRFYRDASEKAGVIAVQ